MRNLVVDLTANCADRQAHPDPRHKGEDVTYSGRTSPGGSPGLGRAADRPCVACSGPAEQWAYRHSDHDRQADTKGREAGLTYGADPGALRGDVRCLPQAMRRRAPPSGAVRWALVGPCGAAHGAERMFDFLGSAAHSLRPHRLAGVGPIEAPSPTLCVPHGLVS